MNIIIDNISHKLVKLADTDSYTEYSVYRADILLGHITKSGSEVHYTARDTEYNIITTAPTLREAVDSMILNIFYSYSFKGDKYIHTLGKWVENNKIQVEYTRNNIVKYVTRTVHHSKNAGDLYIVIDNNRYFYHEFK